PHGGRERPPAPTPNPLVLAYPPDEPRLIFHFPRLDKAPLPPDVEAASLGPTARSGGRAPPSTHLLVSLSNHGGGEWNSPFIEDRKNSVSKRSGTLVVRQAHHEGVECAPSPSPNRLVLLTHRRAQT